ncbi:mucin-5AC-like [Mya arenaria]|uniref:mucin-5AC-like n=1 Tax=Mya arenaria TaxID=6604 RepID=UPI0022E4B9C0|nr:mucin-5AC-like [Mya arenaria]
MDGIRIVIAVLFVMVTFIDASIREPRDVTCPTMFDDFPGKVKYRRRGSRVVFKCPKKMRLHGKKRLDCQPDGTWDSEPPMCITSGCVPFDTSSHVHLHTRDRYSDGSLMIFSCTGNYQLVGTTEAFCNGHDWSATLPQCLSPKELVECDFESDLCGWSQDDGEEREWVRMMGPTQTGGTGPTYDHTYMEHKSGHYMYFEASNPTMEGDRARLISPTYPPAFSGKCFDLWYHMQGPDDIGHVGSLSVYVKGVSEDLDGLDPAFYIDGNQGDRWHRADLQLDDKQEDFQIVIEATKKLSYISDVALDDVRVYTCETLTTTTTTPSTTSTQSTASTASTISTSAATTTTTVTTTAAATTTAPPPQPTTTTLAAASSTAAATAKPSVAKTTETDTSTTMPTQRQETSSATTSITPPTKTTTQITSTLHTQSSKGKSLTTLPTKKSQSSTVTTPKPTVISSTKVHTSTTQSVSTKEAVQTTPVQITTVTHKPFTTTSQITKARTTRKTTTTSSSSSPTTTKQPLTTSTLKTTSKPTVVTQTTRLESRSASTSPLTSTSKSVPKQTTGVTEDRSPKATTTMEKTPTETVTTAKQSIASTTKIPDTARPFSTSILGRKTTTTMSTTAKATTSASFKTSTVPKSGKPTDKVTDFTTGKVSTGVTVSTPNLIDKNITDTSNNKTQPNDDETNVSDSRSQHPSDETLKPLMIGLGVGIVVGLIIIGVIVWFCRRRRYYTRGFEDEMKPITNSASLQSLNGQYYADEYHDNEEFESES